MIPSRSEESETPRVRRRVAFLTRPVGQLGRIDPPVLEHTVLDVFINWHHRFDVFEVVKPRTIRHLVQGSDGDQVLWHCVTGFLAYASG